jgi:hypothetical protein
VCNFRIMNNNNSKKLIEVLLKTIDRVGIKQTIESLQITEIHITENKVLQEAIVGLTCKYFDISKKMLIAGRRNISNRTNAIGVCAVMLSRHCKISQKDISNILRKERSNISKYMQKIRDLDINFKEDNEVIQKMKLIEIDINEFLTNGNNTKIITNG